MKLVIHNHAIKRARERFGVSLPKQKAIIKERITHMVEKNSLRRNFAVGIGRLACIVKKGGDNTYAVVTVKPRGMWETRVIP